jgi:hypothetical protein
VCRSQHVFLRSLALLRIQALLFTTPIPLPKHNIPLLPL